MIRRSKPDADGTVKVTFVVPDEGTAVSVVGSFNDWEPFSHPLRKRSNGTRSVSVAIPAGDEVYFRYLYDGGRYADEDEAEVRDHGGVTESYLRV